MRIPSWFTAGFTTYRFQIFILFLWAGNQTAVADIAPTTFVGSNAYPLESAEVRLEEAEVHITWGDPCSLNADFTLQNEAGKSLDIEVGFPVGAHHQNKNGYIFDDDEDAKAPAVMEVADPAMITITVNGEAITAHRKVPHEHVKELKWGYASWYFGKISLHAGANTVAVRTKLSPSGVYGQGFKRQLSYCIWTGGRWKGPIGHESVEVTFPSALDPSFVSRIHPETGSINGHSIRWNFTLIEPQSDEYDIELEFFHPAVLAKLAEIKAAYQKDPKKPKAALRYATHLFCLGAAKGNSGFPPQELTVEDYQWVLLHLEDKSDRTAFERFYSVRTTHGFAAESNEWSDARMRILRILADSGYSERYPEYQRVHEAREIVEECLKREPKNADAWYVYLTQFWRFSFAARGHWFGSTVYSAPLRRAISSAYKNCPSDIRIKAWQEAMEKDSAAPTTIDSSRSEVPEAWKNEYRQE